VEDAGEMNMYPVDGLILEDDDAHGQKERKRAMSDNQPS